MEEEVAFKLRDHLKEVIRDYEDSKPEPEDYLKLKDSSDVKLDNRSLDSIVN